MPDFSIDQLDAIQAGTVTGDTLAKIANAARNTACGFFKDHPQAVIPNPAYDFVTGLWDGLCKNSGPGLPPTPNFVPGGQCVCVSYFLRIAVHQPGFPDAEADYTVWGPVTRIYLGAPAVGHTYPNVLYADCRGPNNAGEPCSTPQTVAIFSNLPSVGISGFTIISITGTPNNCGDSPYHWPPDPSPPSPTVPGGNTYNVGNTTVNLNIGITANIPTQLTIPIGVNPTINIGSGLSFKFLPDGVNIGDGSGSDTDTLNNINKNTKPTPPPGGPGMNPPAVKPPSVRKEDSVENLVSVQVVLTTLPNSRVVYGGSGDEPVTFNAGWFEFRQAGHNVSRFPINFADNIFIAPKGCDGYAFTLTNGAEGNAIVNTSS